MAVSLFLRNPEIGRRTSKAVEYAEQLGSETIHSSPLAFVGGPYVDRPLMCARVEPDVIAQEIIPALDFVVFKSCFDYVLGGADMALSEIDKLQLEQSIQTYRKQIELLVQCGTILS